MTTVPLKRNANISNAMWGKYPQGLAPVEGVTELEYTLPIPVDAIWVEDGAPGGGDGSESSPYQNIRQALDQTTNGVGAHIVVKDATIAVTSANRTDWMVNDRTSSGFSAINSGAGWATSHTDRANMIVIRAQTPYGVRFNYTGSSALYYSFFHAQAAEYLSYDGFILTYDATAGAALGTGIGVGNNNYITRCIVKREADGQDGSWISMTAGDAATDAPGNDSLVEMCAGVGATRYGFRSGDSTDATQDHCFRLCVGRFDTSEFTQPCATFAHYGSNTGATAINSAFLNCIAIDGQWYDTTNANLIKWGGLYLPKNATNVSIKGMLVLNEEARYAGLFAGEQQGANIDVVDSVIWDISGSTAVDGYRCNAGGAGNSADALTIGNVSQNFYYTGNTVTATNSRANDALNGTEKSILYQNDGADARYVFGSLSQRYGDAGFDNKSTTRVFPFPYEATIKSIFTEQINTAAGHFPASNVSNRGFCLDTSLTDYIIKYVDGTTTIGEVYS